MTPRCRGRAAGSERGAASSKNGRYYDLMTRTVTATEAKAKILALLDEVEVGDEVQITRHGHVVARLVPAGGPGAMKGSLTGVTMSAAEDEELFTTGLDWNMS